MEAVLKGVWGDARRGESGTVGARHPWKRGEDGVAALQQTLGVFRAGSRPGCAKPPALPKEGVARHHPAAVGWQTRTRKKGPRKEPAAAKGLQGREGLGPSGVESSW